MHLDVDAFLPATAEEKAYMVQMRPSSTFFRDGVKRFVKNKVALISLINVVLPAPKKPEKISIFVMKINLLFLKLSPYIIQRFCQKVNTYAQISYQKPKNRGEVCKRLPH